MDNLQEYIKLRTEINRELTHIELDRNLQFVSNPWKENRKYKKGMVVYHGDDSTGSSSGSGLLSWYRANKDHSSNIFNPADWDPIGADSASGNIILEDSDGIFSTISTLELSDDFTVTFNGSTGIVSVNSSDGLWSESGDPNSTIYYENNVIIGDSNIIDPDLSLTVAGNSQINGDLTVLGTINNIDLTDFYNDYIAHTHTIVSTGLNNYTSLYPMSNGQLADVQLSNLQDNDFIKWNNSLKRWVNVQSSVTAHNLGFHTDVKNSVSNSPSNNQILIYKNASTEWENITLTQDSNTGFQSAPFSHNHDSRYWSKTNLLNDNGPIINYDNLFNTPTIPDGDAEYLVLSLTSSLSNERELVLGNGLSATDGGPNGNYTIDIEPKTTNQLIGVSHGGSFIGLRPLLNFVESNNIEYNITDDSVNDKIDIEVQFTGDLDFSSYPYLVAESTPALGDSRFLDSDSTIDIDDNGAGNNMILSVNNDTSIQKINVQRNGILQGTRQTINFIPGSNIGLNVSESSINNRVNVEISFTGSFDNDVTSVNGDIGDVILGLSDINDVSITPALFPGPGSGSPYTPETNMLVYDDDIFGWINVPVGEILAGITSINLNDILDVDLQTTALSTGDMLVYDDSTETWVSLSSDDLFYTQTQLNSDIGESQVHWANLINVPALAPASHTHYVYELQDTLNYSGSLPDNGDVLIWNSVSELWEPGAQSGGGGSSDIDIFDDLTTSSPTSGSFSDGLYNWNTNTKLVDAFYDANYSLYENKSKSLLSYKNLGGKSMTTIDNTIYDESEINKINVFADAVFVDEIDETASTAVMMGVAEQVTADLVLDATSNGQAYFAVYPNGHPNDGERIKNAISPAQGSDYQVVLRDEVSSLIPTGHDSGWIYQYNNGVLYFSRPDELSSTPTTLDLYVYTGTLLSDISSVIADDGDWIVTTDESLQMGYNGSILPYTNKINNIGAEGSIFGDLYINPPSFSNKLHDVLIINDDGQVERIEQSILLTPFTLTETLSTGNATGGSDIVVTTGDAIRGSFISSADYNGLILNNPNNTASGNNSLAIGAYSTASGNNSLAGGLGATASGDQSISIGISTEASGESSFTSGNGCENSGSESAILAGLNNTIGLFSRSAIIAGQGNDITDNDSVILGGSSNDISESLSVILGGSNNNILSSGSGIIGGSYNTIEATALRSVILGGNNITASNSSSVYVPHLVITELDTSTSDDILTVESDGTITKLAVDDLIDNETIVKTTSGQLKALIPIATPSDKDMTSLSTSGGSNELATNDTISHTPIDGTYITIIYDGSEYICGEDSSTAAFYFSDDGGTTAKGFSSSHPNGQIQQGDSLYYNQSVGGGNLTPSRRITLHYLVPS